MYPVMLTLATLFPGADLAELREAPAFTLKTHDDRTLSLADLRGKVLVVGFIFTTCSGTCPATTARMHRLAGDLHREELLKKVHLVSITLDPKRDTPAALRKYRKLYDIEGDHWSFLTGTEAEVNKVNAAWDMWAKPSKDGQLDHPSRIFLVDGKGKIREVYSLEFFKPTWVIEDIRTLLK